MATTTALHNGASKAELHNQNTAAAPKRRKPVSKKTEDEGIGATLCTLICNHQIGTLTPWLSEGGVLILTPYTATSPC